MAEDSEKETEVQWIKFGKVDSISFLGKDTIILGFGNYIVFVDTLKPDKKEVIYQATNDIRGDGVQCLCTHRCLPCFAFAEKCRYPRILINSYPSFETIKTIEAVAETNYVALRFSEMEYLVALTGLPNYTLVIWNWRTGEKMYSQDTNVNYPNQILRISLTSPIHIVQTNYIDKNLTIWEMNVCYKKALLNKHSVTLSQASVPPYAITWGTDGELYIVDSRGYLYSASLENHDTNLQLSWKGKEGNSKPSVSWYKNGLVFTGPGEVQFWRRKSPEGWARVWSYTPSVPLEALVSATLKESLVFWTQKHELLVPKGEPNVDCITIKSYGSKFDFICFIHPVGDYFATFGKQVGLLTVWKKGNGERVSTFPWPKGTETTCMESNPKWPYVVATRSSGRVNILNVYDPTYPIELTELYLTKNNLSHIKFRKSASQFCVVTMDIGEFFLIKLQTDGKMDVVGSVRTDYKVADYVLLEESSNVLKLVIIPVSQLCCKSGHTALVYSLSEKLKTFEQVKQITMPTVSLSISPASSQAEVFCIPHRSRNIYTMNVAQGTMINQFASGHQMKSFSMSSVGNYLITFGVDGLLIVRFSSTAACVTVFTPHHRTAKGIKKAIMDPYRHYIISLGAEGSLVCTMFLGKISELSTHHDNEALLKTAPYKNLLLNPLYAAKAKAKAVEKITGECATSAEGECEKKQEEKTWLELREEQKIAHEELMSKEEKESLYQDFLSLQEKVKDLLDKNYTNSPEEQLPIQAFDLDKASRRQKIEDAKAEREKLQQMQLATIKARDKVSEYIIKSCWDIIQTKGREIFSIIAPVSVESYALLPDSKDEKMKLKWIEERVKIEKEFHKGDYFDPWVPRSDSMLQIRLDTKFFASDANVPRVIKYEEEELDDDQTDSKKDEKESPLVWTGTASHNFIQINPNHYSQFEMTTYFQGWQEISIIEHDIKELMLWFNKQFEDTFAQKEREMANVYDRNNRFRHIIKELSFFHFSPEICKTLIADPEWDLTEHPERIVKVEDNEVKVPMYISPSEQDLINKKQAEAERLRLLMLADDFRERALITMMDGVLEKLWEDEIKKDVPKPKCMIEKEPEAWNEEEVKAVRNYEEAVRHLLLERERYRKILEAEWSKLINTMKESVNKFDEKVAKLHLLKLKVESAIGQENLKSLRIRYRNFQRMEMDRKEEMIKVKLVKNEKKIESMQAELSKLQESFNECKNYYETLQNRDRNLDKNFKKDFPEYSPIICEQLYKLSKKRPRLAQKAAMFATVLNDMGKCAVAGTKPDYLPAECIQYLKDIDGLDSHINAPAVVSEQSWELLCKLRRIKIESELKIRACQNDLAESESTVSSFQKALKAAKETQQLLQNDLQTLRDEKLFRSQNYEIQLVLKEGLVEIPLTGNLSDFDECIMVTKQILNEINGIIKKVGQQKIKAMQKAANFRKGIIFKEWEHKKLRMEIEDLESKLATVEKIKVTKELQAILISRARGFSDEKGFLYLENELAGVKEKFEKTQTELYREIDEMNFKIDKVNSENEELDARITEINVEVNELNLERDKDFEKKQLATNMKRMKMVRERSKLVQKIQDQHNEILVLQTELELLRLRTFPTIKYKT